MSRSWVVLIVNDYKTGGQLQEDFGNCRDSIGAKEGKRRGKAGHIRHLEIAELNDNPLRFVDG